MSSAAQYLPPPGPPPKKPLLEPNVVLQYPVDLGQLANQGWTTLAISDTPSDPLHTVFSELFSTSAQFFNLSEEERMKYRIPPQGDFQVSEEGYSRIPEEKCMITLRKAETTPTEFDLRFKAEAAWRASGKVMRDVLAAIEESLGMTPGVLVRASDNQLSLPQEGERNVATLMRMFRYDRPTATPDAEAESRVVAEPHKDLGLLTIVVGHSPGLECWDTTRKNWVSCENKEGLNATILSGQMLAKFTNARYAAGRHRVFVHPSPKNNTVPSVDSPLFNPSYRFSLVHALRGHLPVHVSYTDFETLITGAYLPALQFVDVSISEIYRAISNAHFNVNISVEERRRQEKALLERAEKEREISRDNVTIPVNNNMMDGSGRRLSRIISLFRRSRDQASVS